MKIIVTILVPAVFIILLMGDPGSAQERVKRCSGNPIDLFGPEGPDEARFIGYPVLEKSSLTMNPVSASVENIRSILGGGRNIERRGNEIHVAFLTGTTSSYKVYWAGSTDNGSNWQLSDHLGSNSPDDDRYPSIGLSSTGEAYVAFHQPFGLGQAYVARLSDPFNNSTPVLHGPLNGPFCSAILSFTHVGPGGNTAHGWYEGNVGQGMVNSSDGSTFGNLVLAYDTSQGVLDAGPDVAIQGDYVIAMLVVRDDPNIVPTDTAINNHTMPFAQFYGFVESTDRGATWSVSKTPYGLNIGDFPLAPADLNGTVGVAAMVTANGLLRNSGSPFIHNGQIYFCLRNGAVTLNDGTFPYGYWDGVPGLTAGWKQAVSGSAWTHHAITSLEAGPGGVISGDYMDPEMGVHPATGALSLVAMDLSSSASGEDELVAFFSDDGTSWMETYREDALSLGFPTGTFLYHSGSRRVFDDGSFYYIDIVLLGDNGGIVNTTLYHTQLQVGVTDIRNHAEVPRDIQLNQNYPNPFNPTTQIRFKLNQNGPANLAVYNALGQKAAELVNGMLPGGEHTVTFDGNGLASGVYFYRLTADGFSQTRKMLFVR